MYSLISSKNTKWQSAIRAILVHLYLFFWLYVLFLFRVSQLLFTSKHALTRILTNFSFFFRISRTLDLRTSKYQIWWDKSINSIFCVRSLWRVLCNWSNLSEETFSGCRLIALVMRYEKLYDTFRTYDSLFLYLHLLESLQGANSRFTPRKGPCIPGRPRPWVSHSRVTYLESSQSSSDSPYRATSTCSLAISRATSSARHSILTVKR